MNRQADAQALRLQLSFCKEKILNQLLRREPPEGCKGTIVDALDSLLPYPGVWEGLELGNWHRYLSLHWDQPIIHFILRHLRPTLDRIIAGVAEARQYFDVRTVRKLALRCPQNPGDAKFIRKSMRDGDLFQGLTNPASRRRILDNILSVEGIIPSLKTLHENMKYFAIGAKILSQHILSEDKAKDQALGFLQRLHWSPPSEAHIDTSTSNYIVINGLDLQLAIKALFLYAIKIFPYVSVERPKKDVRGEKAMEATVDDGFVYMLRRQAQRLGFSSPKIEQGLSGTQPVCCKQFHLSNLQVGTDCKCGKPGLRVFLHLYNNAFLPVLGVADGRKGINPMFVLKDFLDAFFGPDIFAGDAYLEKAKICEPEPGSIVHEGAAEVNMTDAPQPILPIQQQETLSKLTKPGPSRTTRPRIGRGWQPYRRERPLEGRRSLHSEATSKSKGTVDAAHRRVRAAEMSADVPSSTIELANLGAPQRSPVAPPEAELSTGTEVNISPGNNLETTAKASTGPSRTSRHRRTHAWKPYNRERPPKERSHCLGVYLQSCLE